MKMARKALMVFVCAWFAMGGLFAESAFCADHGDDAHATDAHGDDAHTTDAHGGDAHGGDSHGGNPNPLAVDIDLAIWTGVVFLMLFLVLSKFAWPVISSALVEREERIEGNIAAAEAKHEEAKQLLAQHEAKLAGAADEVRALLDEARRDAEHTKSSIIEAVAVVPARMGDGERAADHAMKGLAETSANLAVDLAEKVVRQDITPDRQAALVREALDKLGVTQPSDN